jgi:hypothetical protein
MLQTSAIFYGYRKAAPMEGNQTNFIKHPKLIVLRSVTRLMVDVVQQYQSKHNLFTLKNFNQHDVTLLTATFDKKKKEKEQKFLRAIQRELDNVVPRISFHT